MDLFETESWTMDMQMNDQKLKHETAIEWYLKDSFFLTKSAFAVEHEHGKPCRHEISFHLTKKFRLNKVLLKNYTFHRVTKQNFQ